MRSRSAYAPKKLQALLLRNSPFSSVVIQNWVVSRHSTGAIKRLVVQLVKNICFERPHPCGRDVIALVDHQKWIDVVSPQDVEQLPALNTFRLAKCSNVKAHMQVSSGRPQRE